MVSAKVMRRNLFNLYTEYIMGNTGWMNHSCDQDYWDKYKKPQICRWYPSSGRKWRVTKGPLDEGLRGEWKSWFKIQHSKTKIMASCPIASWQIEREKAETLTGFIFLAPKITADGDCSMKLRCSLLGRKAMTNLNSVLKSRDITLPTKVRIIKLWFFQ